MLARFQLAEGKVRAADEGPIWIIANPDDADKRSLVDKLGIDEHTLSSALDPDELARVEHEPEHVAIIFKRPKSYTHQDDFLF